MATISYRTHNATGRNHGHSDHAEIQFVSGSPMFDLEEAWRVTLIWNDGAYVREDFTTKEEAVAKLRRLGWDA